MKRILVAISGISAAVYFLPGDIGAGARVADAETFRLVRAIGNTENESARGLSKAECAVRKRELAVVSVTLGTGGSVACLPESLF